VAMVGNGVFSPVFLLVLFTLYWFSNLGLAAKVSFTDGVGHCRDQRRSATRALVGFYARPCRGTGGSFSPHERRSAHGCTVMVNRPNLHRCGYQAV
jgi:hypothetical protein